MFPSSTENQCTNHDTSNCSSSNQDDEDGIERLDHLRKVATPEQKTFADLHGRLKRRLAEYARRRFKLSKDDCGDIVQDVFEHLYKRMVDKRFEHRSDRQTYSWLLRKMRWLVYSEQKKRSRTKTVSLDAPIGYADGSRLLLFEDVLEDKTSLEPFANVRYRLDAEKWYKRAKLTKLQRQVVKLCYEHGLKPAEISVEIGKTPENVSRILYKAKEKLRNVNFPSYC